MKQPEQEDLGMVRMWQAVIVQMLRDIGSNSTTHDSQVNRDRAIHFFLNKREELEMICSLAGLCPDWVLQNAIPYIEKSIENSPFAKRNKSWREAIFKNKERI